MPVSRVRGPPGRLVVASAAALCVILGAAAASNSSSFLDCVSQAATGGRGRAALLTDEQSDAVLGTVVGCARGPVLRGLRAVRRGQLSLWDGAVVLHPVADTEPQAAEASSRALGDDVDLASTHDLIAELNRASRTFAMDVEMYPGVTASLQRDARSDDAVNLSFKLDRRALEDETEDNDGDVEDADGDEVRDIEEDYVEDRHGHKKKKVVKGLKKLKKKLAPYLPLLAIPLAIQLLMLPLYIMALKVMALKSILLGKMTLMLVAFNILRNAQQRQL